MTMHIVYYGQPIGKPRMTQRDKWARRPGVVAYYHWANGLRAKLNRTTKLRLTKPTQLHVRAFFEGPAGTHRLGPHTQVPDSDNCLKSVTDALFANDQMIYKMSVEKRWADGGSARVEIEWT